MSKKIPAFEYKFISVVKYIFALRAYISLKLMYFSPLLSVDILIHKMAIMYLIKKDS